jgi:hypothetical protein
MAQIDQPTAPNLGNQSLAAFLSLPDWSVNATNQPGTDGEPLPDTWGAMELCVVALLYRLMRDNFAYENEAWACRQSTPLLQKVESLSQSLQSRPTDNLGQAVTLTKLATYALPAPTLLFDCNGDNLDQVSGQFRLIDTDGAGQLNNYCVVRANGSTATPGDILYGMRATLSRYYYTNAAVAQFQSQNVVASVNVTLQWPENSAEASKIVLLKVCNYLTDDETGALNRMQFEFGLQDWGAFDPNGHGTDYALYLRYYDAGDLEVRRVAEVNGNPVCIGLGREITLGFALLELTPGSWTTSFYVNGVLVSSSVSQSPPSAGTNNDIRLHVGSDQGGKHWAGGPLNNVYYDGAPSVVQSTADSTLHGVYRVGAGYLP